MSEKQIEEAAEPPVSELAAILRSTLVDFVNDGWRDEDGVWHLGPNRRDALDAVDALVGEIKRLRVLLRDTAA